MSFASLQILTGKSIRQLKRDCEGVTVEKSTDNPPGQRPRDELERANWHGPRSEIRGDRRHNGSYSMPRLDGEDDAESQDSQTRA